MPEQDETKEENNGLKKYALFRKEIFTNEGQRFGNPIIGEIQNSLSHHGINKESNSLRFFKSIPTNSVGKKIYLNRLTHKSLSYKERFTEEVGSGIAVAVTEFPICLALLNLEKKFYPASDPLYIPPHFFHNKNFRFSTRFYTPIKEELIFRGALLQGLHLGFTKQLGMREAQAATASSIVNSLIFSALHNKGMRLQTFAGGMIYSGMTYFYDGSLVPAITAHMTNNNIATSLVSRGLRR